MALTKIVVFVSLVVILFGVGLKYNDLVQVARLKYFPFLMSDSEERFDAVVVVGGGLAGMSAAIEAANKGAHVILIDKEPRLGGNSAKASSGINGVYTEAQKLANIPDTADVFVDDTMKSGKGLSRHGLVKKLVDDSTSAIEFLEALGVDLSVLSQLGGHSFPRTLRGKAPSEGPVRNVGSIITGVLEEQIKKTPKIQVLTSSKVTQLFVETIDHNKRVVGLRYVNLNNQSETNIKSSAVILASGGFAFDKSGLLKQYAPAISHLATTNGAWATGDGIKLAEQAGAKLFQMDQVQVHPTGFVDPKDPKNPVKFLAAEALRGCGAIMINSQGKRFVNELGLRDDVSNAILKSCSKFNNEEDGPVTSFMIMNEESVDIFQRRVFLFYEKKGYATAYNNYEELATALHMDPATVKETLDTYNKAADAGIDEFGKKVFSVKFDPNSKLYVLLTTPSIHYTMGGFLINERGEALYEDKNGEEKPIPGLYGAGEVTAGVHGANRLGGNSLLECVVFGRITGRLAAEREHTTN